MPSVTGDPATIARDIAASRRRLVGLRAEEAAREAIFGNRLQNCQGIDAVACREERLGLVDQFVQCCISSHDLKFSSVSASGVLNGDASASLMEQGFCVFA